MMNLKTIDEAEVAKFSAMAESWWDTSGKFKPLHQINPLRIEYILKHAKNRFQVENEALPLQGLHILDIGCGGGLLSEPMCRLGAKVTAIDASSKNISIASIHSSNMGLDIDYRCISAEELLLEDVKFDLILNMEVIEHVANVAEFVRCCAELLKPKSMMFIATLNRTVKSYMLAIVAAEYILRWLPTGTHDWQRFLKPAEIDDLLRASNLKINDLCGLSYNLLDKSWHLSSDVQVNYMMSIVKNISS